MRWPWRRRNLPRAPDVPVHLEESSQAVADALNGLAETRDKDAKVRKTAAALRRVRLENDFARTIRNALKP